MSRFRSFWEHWGVSVEEALQLVPEEVAEHLLEFLNASEGNAPPGQFGTEHFIKETPIAQAVPTDSASVRRLAFLMAEAWNWLERQGFVIFAPGDDRRISFFVSRWGRAYPTRAAVREYRTRLHLHADQLRPELAEEVMPQFLHTNFRAAIQGAFALTERRLRELLREEGSTPADDLEQLSGAGFVNKAFGKAGVLRSGLKDEEVEGLHKLFLGAIGLWRNDSSHWRTDEWRPNDAVTIVLLANYLLGVLEERAAALSARGSPEGQ